MFDSLNEKQKEAVEYINGPLLVLAGAGSGKTKVLTSRICNLILNHNVKPVNILAITFTNKAAKEMKDRVYNMINISNIQISTFHSFGVTILRKYYQLLGYTSNFTILDSDDTLAVIKKIMKDLDYDVKKYNPRIIRNMISSAKNEMIKSTDYSKYANDEIGEIVKKVYEIYDTKLFNNNSLDFDDLLIKPIELFKKHKDVLEEYQEHYRYILIDEYQDTNTLQYTLTKMLADKYKNICVVGDNDQSIYAFRGANYKNILNFEKDYPNTKVILLEENYRSTKNILNVANSVIKNNIDRKDKNLWTNNDIGDKVIYHKSSSEIDESYYVVGEVKKLLNSGINHNEIAVLYRTNSQSRTIEDAFLKENIPYKVIGSFYFYNRKEIKDLIAYLKLIYNYKDDTSLLRIINTPKRGIGEKTISNLSNNAILHNKSMYECIDKGKELEFKNLIEELRELQDKISITSLVDIVLEKTKLKEDIINDVDGEIREEYLEEFKSITKSFEDNYGYSSLGEFLEEISLVSDIEQHKNNNNVVTLMTVHNAKGLEFNYVFMIGLEENIFPHSNSIMEGNIEEERRLFYVAVTRACHKLWLVNARSRMQFGNTTNNSPSRFINEIDKEYILQDDQILFKKEDHYNNDTYSVGEHILHNLYGDGIIIGISNTILTVMFKDGAKTIMKGHKSISKVVK